MHVEALFTLPPKEIISMPDEIHQIRGPRPGSQPRVSSNQQTPAIENSQSTQNAINQHIESIQHEVTGERAKKVDEIIQMISAHVKENMTENYKRVFKQIHPDRLNKAFKMVQTTKRKSKRQTFYLEWFFCSTLLSKIELKVEHWQVSSQAGHGTTGVYTAGIDFSRYDNIVREKELCIVGEIPTLKSPNNIVGQCEISNLEWEASRHVGSLGIIVTKKYRNLGIGTNLIDLAIRESKKLNYFSFCTEKV